MMTRSLKVLLTVLLALARCGALAAEKPTEQTAEPTGQMIVAMERRAMDAWLSGNPDEMLELLDPEITYVHSAQEARLDGREAVQALFERYRGRPLYDRYEMADPQVEVSGDMAVLTYQLTTVNGSLTRQWYVTEIYRQRPPGWRIIHAHISQAAP
jgi:ketosteroid isomerase-like protein